MKREVLPLLRNMAVGDHLTFPVEQMQYVKNVASMLNGQNRGEGLRLRCKVDWGLNIIHVRRES